MRQEGDGWHGVIEREWFWGGKWMRDDYLATLSGDTRSASAFTLAREMHGCTCSRARLLIAFYHCGSTMAFQ